MDGRVARERRRRRRRACLVGAVLWQHFHSGCAARGEITHKAHKAQSAALGFAHPPRSLHARDEAWHQYLGAAPPVLLRHA